MASVETTIVLREKKTKLFRSNKKNSCYVFEVRHLDSKYLSPSSLITKARRKRLMLSSGECRTRNHRKAEFSTSYNY